MKHRGAKIFNEPVPATVRDYHSVVTRPRDLGTILASLEAGRWAMAGWLKLQPMHLLLKPAVANLLQLVRSEWKEAADSCAVGVRSNLKLSQACSWESTPGMTSLD